ncbi:MAG TPA: saccharopine dehydrogenase NADP-binding domain-containing protein [Gemmatimonadaceae bacterium]
MADLDVILYGAAGFTGRQTVAYFAQHAPPGLRWAIAGRSRARLEIARAEAKLAPDAVEIVVADSRDQQAVDAMVGRTRVLLSTAGPFARHGSPIVDACVRLGTHYADITGETPWIRAMIDAHHARAAADGTKIVVCCGFDSVPADIGTFLLARRAHGMGTGLAQSRAYYQLRGGFNGGTVASSSGIYETAAAGLGDPFLLTPGFTPSETQRAKSRDVREPRYDRDIDAWVGPFFMAPVNTRVVRRSAALFAERGAPYGRDFTYQEFQKYSPPLAQAKAIAGTLLLGLADAAMRSSALRGVLAQLLPAPGSGPSVESMNHGWFRCELLGATEDGRRLRATIHHRGDPGNRATVRFLCESALALALDGDSLPAGGGILTPATALGEVLVRRLRDAGVEMSVEGA